VLGVVLVAAPGRASAHSVLLDTAPSDGAVVTVVTSEVTLTFNEPVKGSFSTVAVSGPDGRAHGDGPVRVVDGVVHQPVSALGSGRYRVAWRVVSADGHPVSGEFGFTVALPAGLEPPAAAPGGRADVAAPPESGASAWWWVPVLGALAAAALVLVRAGRRRRAP
jgi:methionine-rich copper-binding protein CopC